MNPTITLEPATDVPEHATVRDYDELSGRARTEFPGLVGQGRVPLTCEDACGLVHGEYVNYTGYYRVVVAE